MMLRHFRSHLPSLLLAQLDNAIRLSIVECVCVCICGRGGVLFRNASRQLNDSPPDWDVPSDSFGRDIQSRVFARRSSRPSCAALRAHNEGWPQNGWAASFYRVWGGKGVEESGALQLVAVKELLELCERRWLGGWYLPQLMHNAHSASVGTRDTAEKGRGGGGG